MNKKIDLRVIKSKTSLYHALLHLLKHKALENITVAETCRMAKISRGTFYLHYTDIDDLFKKVFKEMMHSLKVSYQEPHKMSLRFKLENLEPTSIQIFEHIYNNKSFYEIILSKNVPIRYYYLLFEEVNLLVKKDIIVVDSIDKYLYTAYYANAILGIILHWYKTDFTSSVDYLNTQLVNILTNTKNRFN